jgi:hypothetical protein
MFLSAFNNIPQNKQSTNSKLIKLGDKVAANTKFGLNRTISLLDYIILTNTVTNPCGCNTCR